MANYLYLYTGTSIILKYMHNTNNNTVYEDITLWSTERSCGVQARGVTTPKSIHTSVPMHTTTKMRMWAAVHPCVCGCRAYVATYLLESVARKNSVKTHKFMNLCDFTEFLVQISHTFLRHDVSYLSPNELKALQRYIPASLRLGFLILKIEWKNKRWFNCVQSLWFPVNYQI